MSQDVAVYQAAGEVSPYVNPQQEVARAHEMAKVLQDVVKQANLSKSFSKGGKEHLFFEAWQTIGRFFNCAPEIEWSRPIMHNDKVVGWEARAVVRNTGGNVIASAESMCAKDEPNWASRPAYAIRSMAQTRASSKALRQAFAWVAVLAGYAPTPAEEMDGVEIKPEPAKAPTKQPTWQEPPTGPPTAEPWTDNQRKALWAKCMASGGDRDTAKDFAAWALELSGMKEWTKEYASKVLDDFDELMQQFQM
jgi:hypothetical protein